MWKLKYFLLTVSILILEAASAQAAGEILRNEDGSIKIMNQYNAMKACPTGTHLPTIRELVKESLTSGEKGILEVSQVNPEEVPAGYYKISAINPDCQKDAFYFSYDGYTQPDGDLGRYRFWSSSVDQNDSNYAYDISGHFGYAGPSYRGDYGYAAIRCVPGL